MDHGWEELFLCESETPLLWNPREVWRTSIEDSVKNKCPNCKHRLYKVIGLGCAPDELKYTPKEKI